MSVPEHPFDPNSYLAEQPYASYVFAGKAAASPPGRKPRVDSLSEMCRRATVSQRSEQNAIRRPFGAVHARRAANPARRSRQ